MLSLIATLAVAFQAATTTAPSAELRRQELMTALKSGGYTILVRHARTLRLPDSKESPSYTPAARSEQRNLSDDGVRDVRRMADVFKKYAIPVGEVLSSPLFRCQETAEAFGTPKLTMVLRTFPTTAETQALVAAAPAPGTNRVLVTHHFVIEQHVPGISPGDIGESEVAVVKPTGDGKVMLVGKILLADWEALATPAPAAASGHPAPPPADASLPDTRAGKLARGYIEAFNTGDVNRMKSFIESFLPASPDRPTEARLQTYQQLFGELGPLTITGIETSAPDSLAVTTQSKRGQVTVTLVAAPAPGDRIQSVRFAMMSAAGHHP